MFRPPVFFYDPQLQILCCYIARYYVKKARAPGGHKRFMLTKLGGGTEYIPKIKKNEYILLFSIRDIEKTTSQPRQRSILLNKTKTNN